MNAAQASHLSSFPKARDGKAPKASPAPTKKQAAKRQAVATRTAKSRMGGRVAKARATEVAIPANDLLCNECLQQAEICREQAQEAARMKRFKAARGLFATAIALCQRALSACADRNKERTHHQNDAAASANLTAETIGESDEFLNGDDAAIQAYLQQLNIEMATYSDLARSMERPLNPHSRA